MAAEGGSARPLRVDEAVAVFEAFREKWAEASEARQTCVAVQFHALRGERVGSYGLAVLLCRELAMQAYDAWYNVARSFAAGSLRGTASGARGESPVAVGGER
jgi:hypothetical protein